MGQHRIVFINAVKALALFIATILFASQAALAETKPATISSITSDTQRKIFTAYAQHDLSRIGQAMRGEKITSRAGAVERHKIEKILNDAATRAKKLLADPNYDLTQEPDKTGVGTIHHIANNAYYPLMSQLLKDERYLALINAKDKSGKTVLDNAQLRFRLVGPFLNPTLIENP